MLFSVDDPPSAALVLRVYSAASTPTLPIPHDNYCTHAISEEVTTSSQNRSIPDLKFDENLVGPGQKKKKEAFFANISGIDQQLVV